MTATDRNDESTTSHGTSSLRPIALVAGVIEAATIMTDHVLTVHMRPILDHPVTVDHRDEDGGTVLPAARDARRRTGTETDHL